MKFKIDFEPNVKYDVKKTYDYYKEVANLKIAQKFLKDFTNAIKLLETNPFFQKRLNDYRVFPLKKFPYIIIFEVIESENSVIVLSLFNTFQDSSKWPNIN